MWRQRQTGKRPRALTSSVTAKRVERNGTCATDGAIRQDQSSIVAGAPKLLAAEVCFYSPPTPAIPRSSR